MADNPKLTINIAADNSDALAKIDATTQAVLAAQKAEAASKQAANAEAAAKKDAEAKATAQEQAAKNVEAQVRALKQAEDIQKLINAGKEREAYILQQMQQATRNNGGAPLQRGQIVAVRSAAGAVYDARQTVKPGTEQTEQAAPSTMENLRRVVESSGRIIRGETTETAEKVISLGEAFGQLAPAAATFGGVAGGALLVLSAIGVAAGKAVEQFAELVKGTMESSREIKTMADQLELSTDRFQDLNETAEQAHASPQLLLMATRVSSDRIADAERNPLGQSAKILGRLGFKAEDFDGKDASAQIEMIAKAIASIPDLKTKREALSDMFGRGSQGLMELINNFDKYKSSAADVDKIDEDTINATYELGLSLNDLSRTLQSLTAETGIVRWLSNIAANLYGVVKIIRDVPGAATAMKESLFAAISALPIIGTAARVVRMAGAANLFEHSGEATEGATDAAPAQGAGNDAASRQQNQDEAKNRDVNEMLQAYRDQQAAAEALTDADRQHLEVLKQIREYDRSHGKEEKISPEKQQALQSAARKAIDAQADKDLEKTIADLYQQADAQRLVNAGLETEANYRKLLEQYESKYGTMSNQDKTTLRAAVYAEAGSRADSDLANTIADLHQQAAAQRDINGELEKEIMLEKLVAQYESKHGALRPQQQMELKGAVNTFVDAKNTAGYEKYLKAQREELELQDLSLGRLNRKAAAEKEILAARQAAGGTLSKEQYAEAEKLGTTKYDNAKKQALQESMLNLDQQIKQQALLNAGLEKEAYIQAQIAAQEKDGTQLSSEARDALIKKSGELYDLQHSPGQREPMRVTSLEKYGGGYQGLKAPSSSDAVVNQVQKSNEYLSQMKTTLDAIKSALASTSSSSDSYMTAR